MAPEMVFSFGAAAILCYIVGALMIGPDWFAVSGARYLSLFLFLRCCVLQ